MQKILYNFQRLRQRLVRFYYKNLVRMKLRLIPRSCPFCGNSANFTMLYDHDRYNLPIKTQACEVCGLIMVNPAPSEKFLNAFYSSKEYRGLYLGLTSVDSRYGTENTKKAQKNIAFIQNNTNLPSHSRVMDIGSACGDFLLGLKRNNPGYEIYGVEPDMNFSEKEKSSFSGFFSSIEEIPEDKKLDLVTMWHVFEHIYNPVEFLSKIQRLLSDSGFLIIEVPNYKKYSRIKSIHIAHLFHFDPESIKKIATKAGLTVTNISEENLVDEETGMRVIMQRTHPSVSPQSS